AVLVDQFTRLRDGDRFFYLNQFSGKELSDLLANTSLAKIIERNTGITNLQSNVFFFKASISGTVFSDLNGNGRQDFSERGLRGITVQLQDDSGTVLATAVTDSAGRYRFDNFSGIEGTGNYTVRLVVPTGLRQTTADPATILISRGDINATGVN